jgi:hypothetical protein
MLVYLPDRHVLFAGDFIMPYLGAPFVEEGNLDGLLAAIDVNCTWHRWIREKRTRRAHHQLHPRASALRPRRADDLGGRRLAFTAALRRGALRAGPRKATELRVKGAVVPSGMGVGPKMGSMHGSEPLGNGGGVEGGSRVDGARRPPRVAGLQRRSRGSGRFRIEL